MNTSVSLLLVLLSFTGYAYSQPPRPDSTAEIARSIDEINHAFVVRDSNPFERLYSDGYVSIRSQPIYNSKQQLVAMMKADAAMLAGGRKIDFETLSYESDKPDIRVFGNTAIVNVAKRNLWSYRDSKCLSRYQATETWISSDGGWRLFASHATTFQCEHVPWMPLHKAVAAIGTILTPPTLTDAELPLKAVFEPSNTSQRIFAPGFVYTNLQGNIQTGQTAALAVTEMTNAAERENEALVVNGDTGVFMFRIFRKRGALQVPVQVSIVAAKTDAKWRLVAAHATW